MENFGLNTIAKVRGTILSKINESNPAKGDRRNTSFCLIADLDDLVSGINAVARDVGDSPQQ
jgi:hypothetical protein